MSSHFPSENKEDLMREEYLEVTEYTGDGYKPVIDYASWRVAILRYCEELERPNITSMQKHMESDEVFVLLEGSCTLFIGGQGDEIQEIEAVSLEPLKMYNVKRGTWHTHTLSQNTTVLIVENRDTCDANSPTLPLNTAQKAALQA